MNNLIVAAARSPVLTVKVRLVCSTAGNPMGEQIHILRTEGGCRWWWCALGYCTICGHREQGGSFSYCFCREFLIMGLS